MVRYVGGPLCKFCSTIDFKALFSPQIKLYQLDSSIETAEISECPSCRLFSRYGNGQRRQLEGQRIRNVWFAQHCSNDLKTIRPTSSKTLHYRILTNFMGGVDRVQKQTFDDPPYYEGDLSKRLFMRRPIPDQIDTKLLRFWVSKCEEDHGHQINPAGSATDFPLRDGFRVIDVKEKRVCTVSAQRYATLSYVRGDIMSRYSRDEAIQSDGSLDMEKLPKTLKDAVSLAEILGETYLWIDWICIDQQNPEELKEMISCMDAIYSRASFTIVAAAGSDADAGLPGLEAGTRRSDIIYAVRNNSKLIHLAASRPSIHNIISKSHWNTRGWTYQEHLLSNRCIVFTDDEVFYSCPRNNDQFETGVRGQSLGFDPIGYSHWREGYCLETRSLLTAYESHIEWNNSWSRTMDPSIQPLIARETNETSDRRFLQYIQLIEEYSARKLSNGADVMAVISGILSYMWSDVKLGSALHHGIPLPDIGKGLLWHSADGATFRRRRCLSSSGMAFPSWSWAGWDGKVRFDLKCPDLSESLGYSSSGGTRGVMYDLPPELWLKHFTTPEWNYGPSYEQRPKAGHLKLYPSLDFKGLENGQITGIIKGACITEERLTSLSGATTYSELNLGTPCLRAIKSANQATTLSGIFGFEGGAIYVDMVSVKEEIMLSVDFDRSNLAMLEVCKGTRVPSYDVEQWENSREEVVALLVILEGNYAERIGIACIPLDTWYGENVRREDTRWVLLR